MKRFGKHGNGMIIIILVMVACCIMALYFGCGESKESAGNGPAKAQDPGVMPRPVGSWKFDVDIDNARLTISAPLSDDRNKIIILNGHTVVSWFSGKWTTAALFR